MGRADEIGSIDPDSIILKSNHMYPHKLLCVNYMTYDVRCSQDVINSTNSHHNIMLLADFDPGNRPTNEVKFFKYACVLGTFHVNIIYVGPGSVGLQSQQIKFLWVQWYEVIGNGNSGWGHSKLDQLRFPPTTQNEAFGFVDPSDVIRGCLLS